MSSICPKCKFLLICNALYKDSITECEDFENNQKTNADRIRTMSTHELAEFLSWVSREAMNSAVCSRGVWTEDEIIGDIIIPWDKWLEEEYKE